MPAYFPKGRGRSIWGGALCRGLASASSTAISVIAVISCEFCYPSPELSYNRACFIIHDNFITYPSPHQLSHLSTDYRVS